MRFSCATDDNDECRGGACSGVWCFDVLRWLVRFVGTHLHLLHFVVHCGLLLGDELIQDYFCIETAKNV